MRDKIEITKDIIAKANDYVPYKQKEDWIADVAQKCFDLLSIKSGEEQLPPMYSVNIGLKKRYLMAAFAEMYLGLEVQKDPQDERLMSIEEYDKWANGHVFNQMDRLKKDAEARNKCFDLMEDYKDLSKWLSAQINSLLNVQNDYVVRQAQYTSAQMADMPRLIEQLKDLQRKAETDGE